MAAVTAFGCIDNVEFASSLRCSLLRILDRIERKLQGSRRTCGGVITEAVKQILFDYENGPSAVW